ncbi:t-SNARE VTI1 isoform X1 [Zootermopsis nevadensis]|nr:t-SNARE VTI1 isoform X1 [Zootermopsis nevadensis]
MPRLVYGCKFLSLTDSAHNIHYTSQVVRMSGFIWEDETRHAVLEGHATLERTAESLARSQRTAVETERIAEEVVSELGAQRETLLHSKRRLTDTDHELSQTRVLLRKMTLHVLTNKIILIFIIVLEICILAGVCYIKFSH